MSERVTPIMEDKQVRYSKTRSRVSTEKRGKRVMRGKRNESKVRMRGKPRQNLPHFGYKAITIDSHFVRIQGINKLCNLVVEDTD